MKIVVSKVAYQCYIFPYLKVTYSRVLNGNYELILGWLNREIALTI
jgi:hypothetical protein